VKVPTYRRQLQRTDRTGAGYLTAQVNPNVMALAGQGLASAGQTMFNFGADMLELETKKQQLADKNEAALAVTEFDANANDLYIESTQLANTNPHKAERHFETKLQALYERARPNLSKNALALFKLHAQEKKIKHDFNFNKENINRINDFTKNIINVQLESAVTDASNTDLPYNDRIQNIFKITGKNAVDTTNFDFTPIPKHYDDKDVNILKYHRERIANGTYLENTDGSTTTIYITGVKHPENGRIYMFPGYWEGEKHTEEEVFNKANEEGWWDMYPSDSNNADHKKRVRRLKLFINNDGKKLAKMEKEITTGLNMKLVDEQIISISEAITSNKAAFKDIASNTITSLMQSAPDANAISLGITDGFITDPILRMIWPELSPNDQQELTEKAMASAKKIETQRKEAEEAEEAKLTEKLDELNLKRIKTNDINEKEMFTEMLDEAGYFTTDKDKIAAYKVIEDQRDLGIEGFAEESSYKTLKELEALDRINALTGAIIDARATTLSKEHYIQWNEELKREFSQAETDAKEVFKFRFKYEEKKDMPDQYAEQAVSAYMRSSAALKDYIIKNPEASYSNIIDEANKIIAKEEVGFRAKLEVLYTNVFATQQSRLSYPGLNITLDANDPIKTLLDLMQAGNYDPAIVAAYDDLIVYKNEKIGPYR
jgi:hypothetical protein